MLEKYNLYQDERVGMNASEVVISVYQPHIKVGKGTVVIFAGGGYSGRCAYEDVAYARYINALGLTAFVVDYRCAPNHFPDQLLDARTAVRFVRKNAERFGIDPQKIAVMGSSAGGHLCALLSTYRGQLQGEEYTENYQVDYLPSAQILCYPVISTRADIIDEATYRNLLGDAFEQRDLFAPDLIADEKTPKAFIWHTFEDELVNVINVYVYAEKLKKIGVSTELHVFPKGVHGKNLSNADPYVGQWKSLFENWLRMWQFID